MTLTLRRRRAILTAEIAAEIAEAKAAETACLMADLAVSLEAMTDHENAADSGSVAGSKNAAFRLLERRFAKHRKWNAHPRLALRRVQSQHHAHHLRAGSAAKHCGSGRKNNPKAIRLDQSLWS